MTAHPQVSIIIPAWNEGGWIGRTLEAVNAARARQPEPSEVIVVDNASTDDTAAIAEAAGARVVFEPEQRIARARNAGAAAARGEWLIFVDADTWPDGPLLQATLTALGSGQVCGGGARIRFDRLSLSAYRLGMMAWNALSSRLGLAAGCYLFCTRDAFERVGGFTEKVYAGEEVFLSRRLARDGRHRGQVFHILDDPPVLTSGRKTEWFGPWQHLLMTLVVLLVPFALRSRRLSWFWYRRPK
ncbi:glycosyltransferase [Ectothiorhodospira marina]|uniref:Glycosyl transferase family 2 n=1 Tax=Ectothiorhodospira marina TaxID=1396821 RepID=A0A1H7G2Q2_9GAMM|nr:glycosyltransferase [Ectothiorhodospira marina]SEK29965.1 Glycosyl transferase family 2 [Ectothiorhodospira marina]